VTVDAAGAKKLLPQTPSWFHCATTFPLLAVNVQMNEIVRLPLVGLHSPMEATNETAVGHPAKD
jgi:hypothetical protein